MVPEQPKRRSILELSQLKTPGPERQAHRILRGDTIFASSNRKLMDHYNSELPALRQLVIQHSNSGAEQALEDLNKAKQEKMDPDKYYLMPSRYFPGAQPWQLSKTRNVVSNEKHNQYGQYIGHANQLNRNGYHHSLNHNYEMLRDRFYSSKAASQLEISRDHSSSQAKMPGGGRLYGSLMEQKGICKVQSHMQLSKQMKDAFGIDEREGQQRQVNLSKRNLERLPRVKKGVQEDILSSFKQKVENYKARNTSS